MSTDFFFFLLFDQMSTENILRTIPKFVYREDNKRTHTHTKVNADVPIYIHAYIHMRKKNL